MSNNTNFIDREDLYQFSKPELREQTKQRLIEISNCGLEEVSSGEFGYKGKMSGLYIEMVWKFTDYQFNDYMHWVKEIIGIKEAIEEEKQKQKTIRTIGKTDRERILKVFELCSTSNVRVLLKIIGSITSGNLHFDEKDEGFVLKRKDVEGWHKSFTSTKLSALIEEHILEFGTPEMDSVGNWFLEIKLK